MASVRATANDSKHRYAGLLARWRGIVPGAGSTAARARQCERYLIAVRRSRWRISAGYSGKCNTVGEPCWRGAAKRLVVWRVGASLSTRPGTRSAEKRIHLDRFTRIA